MHGLVIGALAFFSLALRTAQAESPKIVAAENFYGDIARQIGGAGIAVVSILTNPDQDPHEFEASASTARALADARLVICNGAGYDPWVTKLLSASPSAKRGVVTVAALVGKKSGDNPHLWYLPATMPALADALAAQLARFDPVHKSDYARRLAQFQTSLKPLADKIAALRRNYAGTAVTATEPIFGYMAAALGLDMRHQRFQLAIMNGTEPSAGDIAAFERDLRSRAVKVLIYNNQTSGGLTQRMRKIAEAAGVPVVGVSETEPPGKDYQAWMLSQLDALDRALAR
ncbi:MAG TPA: zinc ABC transporter substrate-binding protein [Stellaceae bacterium]|jgi:zinc/manganese transport system substrate-binding protein